MNRHRTEPSRAALVAALLLALPPAAVAARAEDDGFDWTSAVPAIVGWAETDSIEAASENPDVRTEESLDVEPGVQLRLVNFAGEVVVRAGGGNRVKVVAVHSGRERVLVRRRDGRVLVESRSRREVPGPVHYEVTVPDWMDLDLAGVNSDMRVEGVRGGVRAGTVRGDLEILRSLGGATLSTVDGEVRVTRSRGRVEASSVNGSVRILDLGGSVVAESVNGDILLERVEGDSVDASTVNGPVRFIGRLLEHGLYRLASHNGSIRLGLPEDANARLFVRTYRGGFDSSFPVRTREMKKGRRYVVELGDRDAHAPRVDLETFQGRVLLHRLDEPDRP